MNLTIPEGYEIEIMCIKNAEYLTKEYNQAIMHSKAKYKVYLHQDVFIINKNFILDIINLFRNNETIGLIGVAGAKTIPSNGIWWESNNPYGKVYGNHDGGDLKLLKFNEVDNTYEKVKCVDGLIMITQYDIKWREDIFKGWHFYDLSQSMEFLKAGYQVVIPKQDEPWCIHDSGIAILENDYEKYRRIFINEYSDFLD